MEHGVEVNLINDLLKISRAFFALPKEKKQRNAELGEIWGYFDQELTKNRPDWKEIFDLGLSGDIRSELVMSWPNEPEDFKNNPELASTV